MVNGGSGGRSSGDRDRAVLWRWSTYVSCVVSTSASGFPTSLFSFKYQVIRVRSGAACSIIREATSQKNSFTGQTHRPQHLPLSPSMKVAMSASSSDLKPQDVKHSQHTLYSGQDVSDVRRGGIPAPVSAHN